MTSRLENINPQLRGPPVEPVTPAAVDYFE